MRLNGLKIDSQTNIIYVDQYFFYATQHYYYTGNTQCNQFYNRKIEFFKIIDKPGIITPILYDIGQHFIDYAAELVKSGHKFVYVLDNTDWEEKAHSMRQDMQNRSVHVVATNIVFHRVSDQGLPDSGPQQDLKDCNVHQWMSIS